MHEHPSRRVDKLIEKVEHNLSDKKSGIRSLLSLVLTQSTEYWHHLLELEKMASISGNQIVKVVEVGDHIRELVDHIKEAYKNSLPSDKQTALAKIRGETQISSVSPTIGDLDSELLRKYFYILDYVANNYDEIGTKDTRAILGHMLPMLNDAAKVHYFIAKRKFDSVKLKVVENEQSLHCEINLYKKFGDKGIEYIGISKLSCFFMQSYSFIKRNFCWLCWNSRSVLSL